ncbi:MAG: HAMP domain-containing sensor histidine kinase [Tissierellia bacterium]|nr:HAMP domain-containing sensor histidine kinase [Tissierellia bacterium]
MSKPNENLEILKQYLEYRFVIIILALSISIIYAIIIYLFDIPKETVLYGALLSISALIFVGIFDFYKYRNKLKILSKKELPENLKGIEKTLAKLWIDAENKLSENKRSAINHLHEMEDFYTIWAHQIKTPIAAMHMVLEDMQSEEKNILKAEIFRIEEYVQMMMAYLKLRQDSSDYVFKHCNIDEIMRESIRKYAPQFIRKKLKLKFDGGEHEIVTDPKWLGLLFDQILSNAIKYTKEGSINIYWENKNSIVIKDSGIGIPKEDLPRVTELGYTGYNGRTNKKSTGIGLYLAKCIVKNLGSNLKIKSKVGKGTTVIIEF